MRNTVRVFFIALTLFSCRTTSIATKNTVIPENTNKILGYISQVESNKKLIQKKFKGVLKDTQGLNDIGTFEYSTYFDRDKDELIKISNIEITNKKVSETYYFKDDELYFITIWDPYKENLKIGSSIDMQIILAKDENKAKEKNEVYFNKVKIFKEVFYKNQDEFNSKYRN